MKRTTDINLHRRFITSYKKNTAAVFFSFALTFMLLSCILILLHTNYRISNIQAKCEFSPEDCYIGELSEQQISLLRQDTSVKRLALNQEQEAWTDYECEGHKVELLKGDDTYITMISTVIEGRLPQKQGEIAAEKWVLLNLGIEPEVGKTVFIKNSDTGERTELKVTAILSDMFGNKKYGTTFLYTTLDSAAEKQKTLKYTAHFQLKEGTSYDKKVKELAASLNIKTKQIKKAPAQEDMRTLYAVDLQVISVILLVCMVVFYGVYRIASITRTKQYGIFRAIGMKRRQLRSLILLELYQIYLASIPAGIGMGILLAYLVMAASGDRSQELYLYGERVRFELIIPGWELFFCILLTALLIGAVGCMTAGKSVKPPIIQAISGNLQKEDKRFQPWGLFRLRNRGGKWVTLLAMAGKYIVKDLKTSGFVVLTICVGITLFTGLFYKAETVKTYGSDIKEMGYLNGDYAMTMLSFDHIQQGVSRKSAEELSRLPQLSQIKTASGLPIRILAEEGIERNEAYYTALNRRLKQYVGYEAEGFDGRDSVYKSMLYGYNENALRALKPHVLSGDYNAENLKEDEIILCVLRTDDTKANENPGSYREGTPLMDYQVGDQIRMKYRADRNTATLAYEKMKDSPADYEYKTYKVAAIVSFPYMRDCRITVYPMMITSDAQVKKLAPESAFQCIYLDGKEKLSVKQQVALEKKLIRIGSKNKDVSTRSLISEIEQSEMFFRKQMVYVFGIAIVAFLLVMLNLINNLKYRMQARTQEISMLRAVGMSVRMTRRMLLLENILLGTVGILAGFFFSHPVLKYLYQISDMKAFGHPFRYSDGGFLLVSACALGICMLMSFSILKEWKTKQIMAGIGKIE